ncbi:dihydroneopterin aldolase FolB [Gottschalkia purinilytica]|uniref:7,8-dihydroneopterin aldolase n=1 Tax=Gottschalkia purinilytica TaxID=1503 RepID=A0A0L0WCQ8_GOTPU|nr:dihydroneopterin aldolase [Gottschalkia purinilytica]KNF09200.1 dihydroneopterin aldolase FolB [Gottschalkia purinilytica]
MDKIIMKNLGFYGYHGALVEENVLGQKFFLDIEIYADLKKAGDTDNVEDTIHYGEVYELIKSIVEEKRFKLIESLAENIASSVIKGFSKVQEIVVTIKKPEAPVPGIYDYFGVEVRRKRNE